MLTTSETLQRAKLALPLRKLRISDQYKVCRVDELSPVNREMLAEFLETHSDAVILIPLRQGLLPRAVRGSELRSSAASERRLDPDRLRHVVSAEELLSLVLDGVFEIESDAGFVSGPDAARSLGLLLPLSSGKRATEVARLSIEALEVYRGVRGLDAPALSARLYAYNRLPLGAQTVDNAKLERFLRKVEEAAVAGEKLCGVRFFRSETNQGWFFADFDSRKNRRERSYKLYVNPEPGALPEIFETAIGIGRRRGALSFKVGDRLTNVLRPDKFIFYYGSLDELQESAAELAAACRGVRVQATPFTASCTSDGFLTWGSDSLASTFYSPWMKRESFRLWITNRLACYLLAGSLAAEECAVDFALSRLQIDGIDTEHWQPC